MNNKLIISSMLFASALVTQTVSADGSVQHLGQASVNASKSVGHVIVGSSKLVSGAAAIPLGIVGSVGHVSGQVGAELWKSANTPIGEPLPISDDTVTVGPSPKDAVNQKGDEI